MVLVGSLFLLLKYVARKKGLRKVDHLLRKCHIPLGIIILAVLAVHIQMTYAVWEARDILVIISGVVVTVGIIVMPVSYLLRKRLKKNWIRVHRSIALVISVGLIFHIVTYYVDFISYKNEVSVIEVSGGDLNKIEDGSYEGEYDVGYIKASVRVKVKSHQIMSVKLLEHRTERGKKAEKITKDMVERQSTKVDVVSGATNSSLVIEKAVETALLKGEVK